MLNKLGLEYKSVENPKVLLFFSSSTDMMIDMMSRLTWSAFRSVCLDIVVTDLFLILVKELGRKALA